jgi:hypothetical protein
MRWVRRSGWHRQKAFASKLTPTVDVSCPETSASCTELHSSECKIKGEHKTCGSQLADECGGSARWMAQAESIREQAHSYSGSALAGVSASCAEPVGVSLLTNAVGQAELMAHAESIREQARSHNGLRCPGFQRHAQNCIPVNAKSKASTKPVGVSLLANAVGQAR